MNNGGSGIHTFKADHVDIINNTAYGNGTVVGYPDIFTNACQDVNIINNIMYARTGGDCNSKPKNATEIYSHNVYFNGKVGFQGANDLIIDPQFMNLSTDVLLGNFNLKSTSPAIDQGNNTAGFFSQKDILGIARPQGTKPDRGAYEFNVTPAIIITSIAELPIIETATLYPNPAKETLTIRLPVHQNNSEVEILSCNGNSMKKQVLKTHNNEINIESLSRGLYVVVIYQNERVVSVHKFVKQ